MTQIDHKHLTNLTQQELFQYANRVGNTPMVSILLTLTDTSQRVYLKLESANPTGSMKDRTGYALLRYLEEQGRLNRNSVIVESSSGNLGVALAFQCKARGYRFVAILDPKVTQENIAKMEAFGAQLEMISQVDDNGGYLLSRLAHVQALCLRNDDYVWTDQYASPANPLIHYTSTGPEIYQQMDGRVDALLVPVSTGGTLAGIGRFFREMSPSTQLIGVDVYGSVVFGSVAAPHKLVGIGSSRRSSFLNRQLYDTHMCVRDEEALAFCHALYAATGIKLGGSSGAVLAACSHYLRAHPSMSRIVCVCADDGENYASSIFNKKWLQQQQMERIQEHLEHVREIASHALH